MVQIPDLPDYLQNNTLAPLFSDTLLVEYEKMIAATLATCAVQCKLTFGDCRWIDCVACTEGLFGPGGTILSGTGSCSVCNGDKQVSVDEEIELCLAVEWDSRKFTKVANIDLSEISAQVMTHIEYCTLLKGMKYIELDTCNQCCTNQKFKISGDPYPCGFGRRKAFAIVNLESV